MPTVHVAAVDMPKLNLKLKLKLPLRRKKPEVKPLIHKPRREEMAEFRFPKKLDIPNMVLFSDLHLYGKHNKAISVPPESVNALFAMLQRYRDNGYELYGLGDILEGWRFRTKQILKLHPEFTLFLQNNVHIIRGNHDWDTWVKIEKEFGKKSHEFIQVGPIFMSHGHEADPFNRKHAWYSRYATKFAGVLKQAGFNTDRLYRRARTKHGDKLKQIYRVHTQKLHHTIAPEATIFCYGHLHMPYLDASDPNAVIVNLGSIANHIRVFSYVEITPEKLILWKVTIPE